MTTVDILNEEEIRQISEAVAGAPERPLGGLAVVLHQADAPSDLSLRLEALAQQLVAAGSGRIALVRGDATGVPDVPALSLAYGRRANLHYLALPEGPEKAPFLDAVLRWASPGRKVPDWIKGLEGLAEPAKILTFIASTCPHCPRAVRAVAQAALACREVDVSVIDAQRFEPLAERYKVRSVPLSVLDGGLSLAGVVAGEQLVRAIRDRGGSEHEAALLRSLVESGRFEEAASRVITPLGGKLFVEAWARSTTSARVGLMLVAQTVLGNGPTALDALVGELGAALREEDAALRGDTADLLGQIGHPEARPGLEDLLKDPNPDVAEIAAEALEALR